MTRRRQAASLPGLVLLLLCASAWGEDLDRFRSFAELSQQYAEERDFRITMRAGQSDILVSAIHGGTIEPGTSELASLVAGSQHALYLLEALVPEPQAWDLHITSTRFDEPRAQLLVQKCRTCVAIHGYWHVGKENSDDPPTILLGGLNAALRERIAAELGAFAGRFLPTLQLLAGTGRFSGLAPANFVNRPQGAGVQLELSRSLRQRLLESPSLMEELAASVRRALDASAGSTSSFATESCEAHLLKINQR